MESNEKGMTALSWIAPVQAGKLPSKISREIAKALHGLDGKRVELVLREYTKRRGIQQNRFYHGPFIQALQACFLECGYRLSGDDLHAALRDAFAKNSYAITLPDGTLFTIPPSTKRLGTMEFEGYLEEIRAHFATEFGWILPFPND